MASLEMDISCKFIRNNYVIKISSTTTLTERNILIATNIFNE